MPQTDSSMNQAERLSAVQEPGGTQDPGRLCMNKQISEWMTGDRSRLRADAVVVCNAISKDKMLSRRICRYVDDQQQAEGLSHMKSPDASSVTHPAATTSTALGPALTKLRDVMAHKSAMRKLLAHFGGPRPHAGTSLLVIPNWLLSSLLCQLHHAATMLAVPCGCNTQLMQYTGYGSLGRQLLIAPYHSA